MSGALNTTLILALFAVMALRPPMPRRSSPFTLQWALGWWINEAPFIGLWWLLAGTMGTLIHPEAGPLWWLVAGFTAVDVLLLRGAGAAGSARPALSGRVAERLRAWWSSRPHARAMVAARAAGRIVATGRAPHPQPALRAGAPRESA